MRVRTEDIPSQELISSLCSLTCRLDALKIQTGPDMEYPAEIDDRGYQQEEQREDESQLDERLATAVLSTHESLRNSILM